MRRSSDINMSMFGGILKLLHAFLLPLILYIMSSALQLRRAVSATSNDLLPTMRMTSTRHRRRRVSRTITTLQYPEHSDESPFDLQIFDIFDAPSRLGESSKILAGSRPSPSSSFLSPRPLSSSARRRASSHRIDPLPAPIIFDGPAQPRHIAMMSYRVGRTRPSSTDASHTSRTVPLLPEPVIFDGPSQLRSRSRGSSTGNGSRSDSSSPTLMLLLGAAGAVVFAGCAGHDPLQLQGRISSK
ncbi:unnamed protein product [Somion occarium]|uniref:Uncharacterized protein n=1 Tax=Somion occarium TaxID=3059160 RepID=A0ABP1DT76_9APHY